MTEKWTNRMPELIFDLEDSASLERKREIRAELMSMAREFDSHADQFELLATDQYGNEFGPLNRADPLPSLFTATGRHTAHGCYVDKDGETVQTGYILGAENADPIDTEPLWCTLFWRSTRQWFGKKG